MGSQLEALESEKAELVQSLSAVEAELVARGEELERAQGLLATERESGVKAAEALQNQLNEKVGQSVRQPIGSQRSPDSNARCSLVPPPPPRRVGSRR